MSGRIGKVPFLIILSVLFGVIFGLSLGPADRRLYNDLKAGRGLYNSDDNVTVLTIKDFKSSVYGTENAWLVEFYNSWCGFCHRFAPVWKTLASDIYGWKDVITVAAVDCANDDNNPLCREYEIMHYPMLKFFPANSKPDHMGITINKGKTVEEIRHSLVDILKKEHMEGRGAAWPSITPYRNSDTKNLWKNIPKSVKFTVLIFEDTESYIGTEVILDLHSIKSINVRTVLNQNEAVSKLMEVNTFPSVVIVESDMNTIHLSVDDKTRESFRKAIKIFLQSKNISVPKEEVVKTTEESRNVEISDLLAYMAAEEEEKKKLHVKEMGDVVFQLDLEKALSYSLHHEIAARKVISGMALDALRKYLDVLIKYLPIGKDGLKMLQNVRNLVSDSVNIVKGQSLMDFFRNGDNELEEPFTSKDWIGCKGSQPHFRGYPCGLWTLFHTLSVNALIQNDRNQHFNNREVLDAMLGYVTHYFGCQDCSNHFQEMAARSLTSEVEGPKESVLWLWKAHNEVNKRLAGDITEDPQHPKIQFPSPMSCPTCRHKDGSWNVEEVLLHLKQMYSKQNILQIGMTKPDEDKTPGSSPIIGDSVFVEHVEGVKRTSGWNFNVFDVSLCLVLYASSALILVLVGAKFFMRRGYRKKLYVHDLLGKV